MKDYAATEEPIKVFTDDLGRGYIVAIEEQLDAITTLLNDNGYSFSRDGESSPPVILLGRDADPASVQELFNGVE